VGTTPSIEAAAGSAQQAGDLDALHEYFGQVSSLLASIPDRCLIYSLSLGTVAMVWTSSPLFD
jgi:hypothetical protein